MWILLSKEPASFHPSGSYNLDVAPTFLKCCAPLVKTTSLGGQAFGFRNVF
jgi:hypothetical protein